LPKRLSPARWHWDLFETTSFTPVEQQVVYLTTNLRLSLLHGGGIRLAKMIGMTADDIAALQWHCVERSKLQALRQFTQRMIQARGWVENELKHS